MSCWVSTCNMLEVKMKRFSIIFLSVKFFIALEGWNNYPIIWCANLTIKQHRSCLEILVNKLQKCVEALFNIYSPSSFATFWSRIYNFIAACLPSRFLFTFLLALLSFYYCTSGHVGKLLLCFQVMVIVNLFAIKKCSHLQCWFYA